MYVKGLLSANRFEEAMQSRTAKPLSRLNQGGYFINAILSRERDKHWLDSSRSSCRVFHYDAKNDEIRVARDSAGDLLAPALSMGLFHLRKLRNLRGASLDF